MLMRRLSKAVGTALLAPVLMAQPAKKAEALPKAFRDQSASSITFNGGKEGEQSIDITNVAYDVTGDSVAGRPRGSRLVTRVTTRQKEILGDKGLDSTVSIEAWPLGVDLKQKPLYAISITGMNARSVDGDLWVIDRAVDGNSPWYSVYKMGTGQHLLDTYVEMLRFTVSRADGSGRYAGLEVPPDNTADARLKDPHVVAVLSYASSARVIREVLITCTDEKRAQLLRSYDDTTRTVTLVERQGGRDLRITFEDNYPSPPRTTVVTIPVGNDDLDVAHAQLPVGLKAGVWKR